MAELLLGACLAGDAEPVGAAAGANPAYPAALALVGLERERVAVLEMRDRVAHRTADDLAPPAFEFDPEPAVGRVGIAQIVPEREQARCRRLVAGALGDDQVERRAAALVGMAVLAQLVIVELRGRADVEALAERKPVRGAGDPRYQPPAPPEIGKAPGREKVGQAG